MSVLNEKRRFNRNLGNVRFWQKPLSEVVSNFEILTEKGQYKSGLVQEAALTVQTVRA